MRSGIQRTTDRTIAALANLQAPRKSVVVDSNLLLLLAVGLWNPRAIKTHKRLSSFNIEDFEVLRDFLSQFKTIVTTAHVLTEVSNLAGAASGQMREMIFLQLQALFLTLEESHVSVALACSLPEFRMFGLTDAALTSLCPKMLLLTEDGRLASHLSSRGFTAITLEHVRAFRGFNPE